MLSSLPVSFFSHSILYLSLIWDLFIYMLKYLYINYVHLSQSFPFHSSLFCKNSHAHIKKKDASLNYWRLKYFKPEARNQALSFSFGTLEVYCWCSSTLYKSWIYLFGVVISNSDNSASGSCQVSDNNISVCNICLPYFKQPTYQTKFWSLEVEGGM